MSTNQRGKGEEADKGRHGPRSDVNWEGGSGRQPYSNQGSGEAEEPSADADHVPEGNAGRRAGRNIDDIQRTKRKP